MTDADRMLAALREAGRGGVHTHDLRRAGISGNPSQRAADLEDRGYKIRRVRENRGKRPGARFFLVKGPVEVGAADVVGADPGGPVPPNRGRPPVGREAHDSAGAGDRLPAVPGAALSTYPVPPASYTRPPIAGGPWALVADYVNGGRWSWQRLKPMRAQAELEVTA